MSRRERKWDRKRKACREGRQKEKEYSDNGGWGVKKKKHGKKRRKEYVAVMSGKGEARKIKT